MREFKIYRKHGRQYIRDLRKAVVAVPFHGRPVISGDITREEAEGLLLSVPARQFRHQPLIWISGNVNSAWNAHLCCPGRSLLPMITGWLQIPAKN